MQDSNPTITEDPTQDDSLKDVNQQRCPVCGSATSEYLCSVRGFDIQSCTECQTDYVINPPNDDELAAFYDRPEWFEGGEEGGYSNYDVQTESSIAQFKEFLGAFGSESLAILDVGCGYGNHLEVAASLGWECFGIEPSDHARSIAISRLGSRATIVKSAEELIPHTFDVVLMLDVVEHVMEPRKLFYPLFALGAIRQNTTILLTTPNAGSHEAVNTPSSWRYRHPPSHLVFYKNSGLQQLLHSLRFREVTVRGIHPTESGDVGDISRYEGLEAIAKGSDFIGFMQERYVPSTWSEIAEYEHLPRYLLAKSWATGGEVLDFGCGTGYGTAMLARVASSAVGVDIDESALDWARHNHRWPNLRFERNSDFGRSLEEKSFDLITCFEMIEHVNAEDQIKTLEGLARALKEDGVLLISTPNPAITSLYGENPYHLKEHSREEFKNLLSDHFRHVKVLDQHTLVGVFFSYDESAPWEAAPLNNTRISDSLSLAYIAICSQAAISDPVNTIYADTKREHIPTALANKQQLSDARIECYSNKLQLNQERAAHQTTERQFKSFLLDLQEVVIDTPQDLSSGSEAELLRASRHLKAELNEAKQGLKDCKQGLKDCKQQLANYSLELSEARHQLVVTQNSQWLHLGALVRQRAKPVLWCYRKGRGLMTTLRKRQFLPSSNDQTSESGTIDSVGDASTTVTHPSPYRVQHPEPRSEDRVKVLHAIANFCLGGSSRLVVDLMENLGGDYAQRVLTRYIPEIPAYTNLDIQVISHPASSKPIRDVLLRCKPDFVHVHYWGDCDLDWYKLVFEACEQLAIPVLQNINTPVAPYQSKAIRHNVYVSEYVLKTFAPDVSQASVIHPGSDFDHFSCEDITSKPDDCIGMVYRLENDKLNQNSIDVFIEVARRRPSTRCLIVGDGELMQPFRQAVEKAGLTDNFEFPGYVKYDDLPRYYNRMTIFVAPVWKESFGQVTPFAMNMGIPVVGYAVGALPDIINNPTLTTGYGDSSGLAEIILDLLDDRERRLEIGRANQELTKRSYSVEAMVSEYKDIYQDLFPKSR